MAWTDDILAFGIVAGLIYAAWQYKIKPELERREKEKTDQKSKVIDATYSVQNGNK